MRVLLLEPDVLQAACYREALERAGNTVVHVFSAQAAIQAADDNIPDVVVLELQLPQHNGVEFLYEFRSYKEWLKVPVIIYSFVAPQELAYSAILAAELAVMKMLYKPNTTLTQLCTVVQSVQNKVVAEASDLISL